MGSDSLAGVLLFLFSVVVALAEPPTLKLSPSGSSKIKAIPEKADSGALVLEVSHEGRVTLRTKATGFLQDCYWSRGERFAALNIQDASSGNFVWIIDTWNGAVVYKPGESFPSSKGSDAGHHSEFDDADIHRQSTLCKGWNEQDQIQIRTETIYSNVSKYLREDSWYEIRKDKLVPKKTDSRALAREADSK